MKLKLKNEVSEIQSKMERNSEKISQTKYPSGAR